MVAFKVPPPIVPIDSYRVRAWWICYHVELLETICTSFVCSIAIVNIEGAIFTPVDHRGIYSLTFVLYCTRLHIGGAKPFSSSNPGNVILEIVIKFEIALVEIFVRVYLGRNSTCSSCTAARPVGITSPTATGVRLSIAWR